MSFCYKIWWFPDCSLLSFCFLFHFHFRLKKKNSVNFQYNLFKMSDLKGGRVMTFEDDGNNGAKVVIFEDGIRLEAGEEVRISTILHTKSNKI